ncbi:glycosyltransferase family 2 protein [bacterium]|nr:glycosyltransferase family 2 protein [bacterium]
MPDQPKVSILIPCHNAERWVAEAIQSALDQTHEPKEVIVVDDGSTDNSINVIKTFGARIRWQSQPNRGGNYTRNRLLEMASGEWVQFLDADDYLLPTKIENQLSSTYASCTNEDGIQIDCIYSPPRIATYAHNGSLLTVDCTRIDDKAPLEMQWIRWQVAQTGTALWKADSLREIGGWNETYSCCQDNELTLRGIQSGLFFHLFNEPESVYRIWSTETVCRRNPGQVIQVKTTLLDEMLQWLQSNNTLTKATAAYAGQVFFELTRTLASIDISLATQYRLERIQKGHYSVSGPASSHLYTLCTSIAGFEITEHLANFSRARFPRHGWTIFRRTSLPD